MNIPVYKNPPRKEWATLIKRPMLQSDFLDSTVRNIINRVRTSGDNGLRELTKQFDKKDIQDFLVSKAETEEAGLLDAGLRDAIKVAAANIEKFHAAQIPQSKIIETTSGVQCWRKAVGIDKAGIYIPGGSAPLFSTVLMLGIPAKIAGCREVILCSPPDRSGKINPAILFAAQLAGINKIYKIGGAQAIAAMAFGTETIPRVDKIFGPGNQYVTKAKQIVADAGVAIDIPAGPSEVLVMADETAVPEFVAADLISQAEHGEDSQVILIALSESLLSDVQSEIARQLVDLPRSSIAEKALSHSRFILMDKRSTGAEFINEYAPEHLILCVDNPDTIANDITNAGSVFLGNYSPEAVGDYASGTNHTLPTNGFAKAYGGVSTESFMKYITFQRLTPTGLKNISTTVTTMASAEGLEGHGRAITVRLKNL